MLTQTYIVECMCYRVVRVTKYYSRTSGDTSPLSPMGWPFNTHHLSVQWECRGM